MTYTQRHASPHLYRLSLIEYVLNILDTKLILNKKIQSTDLIAYRVTTLIIPQLDATSFRLNSISHSLINA